jgi:hypothetical protein
LSGIYLIFQPETTMQWLNIAGGNESPIIALADNLPYIFHMLALYTGFQ